MACTLFRVHKGEWQCWTSTLELAQIARRAYPELKGAHIRNVLQMAPEAIQLGRLYKGGELQPERKTRLIVSLPREGAERLASASCEELTQVLGIPVLSVKLVDEHNDFFDALDNEKEHKADLAAMEDDSLKPCVGGIYRHMLEDREWLVRITGFDKDNPQLWTGVIARDQENMKAGMTCWGKITELREL